MFEIAKTRQEATVEGTVSVCHPMPAGTFLFRQCTATIAPVRFLWCSLVGRLLFRAFTRPLLPTGSAARLLPDWALGKPSREKQKSFSHFAGVKEKAGKKSSATLSDQEIESLKQVLGKDFEPSRYHIWSSPNWSSDLRGLFIMTVTFKDGTLAKAYLSICDGRASIIEKAGNDDTSRDQTLDLSQTVSMILKPADVSSTASSVAGALAAGT